ncbi:MAG: PKD domain-containing protein [Deltaproteobacteria bacterium]|nr:PKD domain-containing protein [Deltaproteobacteria bacterium]
MASNKFSILLGIAFLASCADEAGGPRGTTTPRADTGGPGPFDGSMLGDDASTGDAGISATPDASAPQADAGLSLNGVPFYGSGGSATGGTGCVAAEVCNNGVDDNCDTRIDENCPCTPGELPCYTGFPAQAGVGVCTWGTQTCTQHSEDLVLGPCLDEGRPQQVVCGGGMDYHCNGIIDEGCNCNPGETRACYTGPTGTSGVGLCHDGTQACVSNGSSADWGPCEGEVVPAATNPCDGQDHLCNGDPSTNCECVLGTNQACYSGPVATRNVGLCHDGTQECVQVGGVPAWGPCTGEALPAAQNICDGQDHLCNNNPASGCACVLGTSRACYEGPAGTENVGVCHGGSQSCTSVGGVPTWGSCTGQVLPSANTCDGVNRACNADPNLGCDCTVGTTRPCYDGPVGTAGVGLCHGGVQTCGVGAGGVGSAWGTCTGQVVPAPNTCDGIDRQCDNNPTAGCNCILNETRACYDGPGGTQGVGICRAGTQTCNNASGSLAWGACSGQILPQATDVCGNNQDDNCVNGVDEGCGPAITCPGNTSVLAGQGVQLTASASSPGRTIAGWSWVITNAPIGGVGTPNQWAPDPPTSASETFTPFIVGTYTIHVTATDSAGASASCDVQVTAQGHGLRATLTWDGIGDIDLHVHNGNNSPWFSSDDCFYGNCQSTSGALPWDAAGVADDPRLDFDNVTADGPENTSIDVPALGRSYTIGVHNYAYRSDLGQNSLRHATIQIFCGGSSVPSATFTSNLLDGTAWGPNCNANAFWKVASVVFTSPDTCTVTPVNAYTQASPRCSSF